MSALEGTTASIDARRAPSIDGVTGTRNTTPSMYSLDAINPATSLDQEVNMPAEESYAIKKRIPWRRIIGFTTIGLGCVIGVILVVHTVSSKQRAAQNASLANQSARIDSQNIPLAGLNQELHTAAPQEANTLTINGQVNVNDALVLKPTAQPGKAVAGQLYYDSKTNLLGYYNGSAFVYLQSPAVPAAPGAVTNITNNTSTVVIQGSSVSITGTSGTIGLITGNTITDSLLSQSGGTVTVAGNMSIQNGGTYQIGGVQIASAALSNDANLAKLDASQTFTGANTFKKGSNSTTAFQVQNASGANLFAVDSTNSALVLGADGAAPTATTIRGGAAVGNNLMGANMVIQASNGTGVGGSGSIIFQTAPGVSNPLVTVDATSGAQQSGTAPMTFSHTTGNHADRLLIVSVDTAQITSPSGTPAGDATSVSYNGVPLTLLTSLTSDGQAHGSVWYLANPAIGAHSISATFTGSNTGVGVEATTFYNVDTSAPIAAFATQTVAGSTISTNLTPTSSGQGIYDVAMSRGNWGIPVPGGGLAKLFQQGTFGRHAGTFRQGLPGSTTMSWSGDAGAAINQVVMALTPQPNVTPDPLTEALRITQNGTLGISLSATENALSTLTLGGSADRTIAVNQNPTTGAGHNLTIQAGGGAIGNNNGGDLVLQGGLAAGTGAGGAVTVKPQTDSANAFRVQNAAASSTVLSVDSTNRIVTVTALVTGNITVNGHIITAGTTPGSAAGAAACTTPSVSVSGNDTSGTITVTTGTGCAANGALATITFATAFGAAPRVVLTPGGPNALTLGAYVDNSTVSTTSFTIGTNNTPTDTTTYRWNYIVVQ